MIAMKSLRWILAPLSVAAVILIIWYVLFQHFALLLLSTIFFILTLVFMIFFRDPKREIEEGIISPADGKIRSIDKLENRLRVSIFMNLHNVHVNRVPIEGTVTSIEHTPGKHKLAFKKTATNNERVMTKIQTMIGEVQVEQITGAFARRIVPYISPGIHVKKGQKLGIVRFGSRVDLYLPVEKVRVVVQKGMRIKAGNTIAEFI
jgi:phosphatidylserine decarboxylase